MSRDPVECSRCQETFPTRDDLVVHSIETHAGDPPTGSPGGVPDEDDRVAAGLVPGALDEQTTAQLRRVLETRSTGSGALQAMYGQRFVAGIAGAILVLALALTGLHAAGVVQTAAYTFALGALFGLTLAYLHAFVRAIVR